MVRCENQTHTWNSLLGYIAKGDVIPVVGLELFRACYDGEREETFYSYISRRIGMHYQLDVDLSQAEVPLANAVTAYVRRVGHNKIHALRSFIQDILQQRPSLPIPPAIQKLAAIDGFAVFVNLTFCPFLEEAIAKARPGWDPGLNRFFFAPKQEINASDFDIDTPHNKMPLIYYLMGHPSDLRFALSEEDLLEFFYALQQGPPRNLFNQLRNKHTLLLGCNYPDWLARFFLRMSSNNRLSYVRDWLHLLADETLLQEDNPLQAFVSNYCELVDIHSDGGAIAFVNELHSRWLSRKDSLEEEYPAINPNSVFISYAREDAEAAKLLYDELREQDIDAWLDLRRLEPGDWWDRQIRASISTCALFLPLISLNTEHIFTDQESKRYLQQEWDYAVAQLPKRGDDKSFIIPIVMDGVDVSKATCPASFREANALAAPSREPSARMVRQIRDLLRSLQKARRRCGG